ncbi:thiol:disulfide interchange protein [Aliidiomarina sanyensis]|uniref:Thiol:disulfide interchange protein n=2 Tax=Aliidiomarina sanyensis TaxID=1249555 RepID=A0A432WG14_9GAMM|nr:thiol:disulfide interchange protein [Aliidiomarina sanyensis]
MNLRTTLYVTWISCLLVLLSVTSAHASRTEIVEQPHLEAQMLSEYQEVTPGQTFAVAAKLMPETGWHTYWINPGDSGLATVIEWTLPEGVEVSDIEWPVASKYNIGPLSNYGFEGTTYLISNITIPADFAEDFLSIQARVDWLVCEDWCIPGTAEFDFEIPVGSATLAVNNVDSFAAGRANLPEIADWRGQYDIQSRQVTLIVDHPEAAAMGQSDQFYAYVGAGELVEHFESGDVQVVDDLLIVRRTLNTYFNQAPDSFPLLLVDGQRAVQLTVTASDETAASSASGSGSAPQSLLLMAGFAFLGGLILNLMPCVFPVLSLKALHLANSGHRQRGDALWYTLGVILTFVAFAALLLALRGAGQALGWGFQLQNPWLIATLALLFVAIGLNLSGVFQFGTRLMQLGHSETAAKGGAKGSFSTGVLAVIIASPCTAPFMGAALGFAITQSTGVALLIFASLGLGMASPFIALAFIPGASRWLPKPGAWMETFKQWMAIPMYLTTVWLIWVFGRQAGIDSAAILLIGLVLFSTALWWHGKGQLQATRSLGHRILVLVMLALGMGSLPAAMQFQQGAVMASEYGQSWQAWSPEKLETLKGEQPVFVNMTADWCITCLANERVALETSSTRALFAEHDITYLKGDWTLRDERITAYLEQYQRNGVPLYVLYWPGQEPQILPQILTNGIVSEAIQRASETM